MDFFSLSTTLTSKLSQIHKDNSEWYLTYHTNKMNFSSLLFNWHFILPIRLQIWS